MGRVERSSEGLTLHAGFRTVGVWTARYKSVILGALVSCGVLIAGPQVEIEDLKGRTLSAELISVGETSAELKKSVREPAFTVEFSLLTEESIQMLKETAEAMPVVYPRFEADVVVSKRRKTAGGSWYMKSMTIGGKVIVTNQSMRRDFPPTKGRLVFIGQDQRLESIYQILSVNKFDVSPAAGREQEIVLKEFVTKYDGDNKGRGNIGGFKYDGYLLILYDEDKRVVFHKTLSGSISKAIDEDPRLPERFLDMKVLTRLSEKMVPLPPTLGTQ